MGPSLPSRCLVKIVSNPNFHFLMVNPKVIKMRKHTISAFIILSFAILTGFNTDNAIVPRTEILSGGPPKDGIPAILKPRFVAPDQAAYLAGSDDVIGVRIGNAAKAYPIKILNWHEVVNDTIGGVPVAVTF